MQMNLAWDSVSVPATDVIAMMRKSKSKKLEILFVYADEVYRVGVNPENAHEPYYMDEETYPSMFVFCSTACIANGFLLPDLQQNLTVLSVDGGDPAAYFS